LETEAVQSEKHVFDDISKFLNGVAGTVAGMGREAQEAFRERNRQWLAGMDLVSREEFDAVKQMAATARAEAEALKARVAALETAAGIETAPKAKSAPKAKAAPKAAPKAKTAPKPRAAKK
jgi:BMFP domain-containing protein YqiC